MPDSDPRLRLQLRVQQRLGRIGKANCVWICALFCYAASTLQALRIIKLKHDTTQQRWITASKDRAFDRIRDLPVFETQADHFLRALERGRVATNVFLRRLHNSALDMGWLPWAVLPKRQWPKVEYGAKRAITWGEHQWIIEREQNPERRSFYELCWLLGGSQDDIAGLRAEDVDWDNRVVS
jgi:hypothetical protein